MILRTSITERKGFVSVQDDFNSDTLSVFLTV